MALPTSEQMHVTDTAGKMHAIGSLIAPGAEPSPPQPHSLLLAIFPYRQVDGDVVAVETLKRMALWSTSSPLVAVTTNSRPVGRIIGFRVLLPLDIAANARILFE